MKFLEALRKFNVVSFALLSMLAIGGLGLTLIQVIQEWRASEKFQAETQLFSDNMEIIADKVQTRDRSLALYWTRLDDGQRKRDIRFVDLRDGTTYRLSNDPAQLAVGFEILKRDQQPETIAIGYTAMLRAGGTDTNPLFDAVVGRLDDMKQFTVEQNISRLQFPTMLDDSTVSMVLWDRNEQATFCIFDIRSGMIVSRRSLDMKDRRNFPASQAPPQNRFQ